MFPSSKKMFAAALISLAVLCAMESAALAQSRGRPRDGAHATMPPTASRRGSHPKAQNSPTKGNSSSKKHVSGTSGGQPKTWGLKPHSHPSTALRGKSMPGKHPAASDKPAGTADRAIFTPPSTETVGREHREHGDERHWHEHWGHWLRDHGWSGFRPWWSWLVPTRVLEAVEAELDGSDV
jgi:hypothetical protein